MAITWTETLYPVGGDTGGCYKEEVDLLLTGTGTLAAAEIAASPDLGARPFSAVQVLWTSGALTGQVQSDNSGVDANYSAPYDEEGAVLPAIFSALGAARLFSNPKIPAARRNRVLFTADAAGFEGTIFIFASRRRG